MRINQNIAAFNAYRNLNNTQNSLSSSLEKLSSGFRINRAADDASGLVNSENLRSQIGGLKVATRNAQDAISMVQTAEGAQTEVHSILQRMRDLAVQSGNLGTNDGSALKANQDELNELVAELDRISEQTQFGTLEIFSSDTFDPVVDAAAASNEMATAQAANFSGTAVSFDITVDGATSATTITIATSVGDLSGSPVSATVDALNAQLVTDGVEATFSVNDAGNLVVASNSTGDESSVTIDNFSDNAATALANAGLETMAAAASGSNASGGAVFQVGANDEQVVRVGIKGVDANTLGVDALQIGDGATEAQIAAAISNIDTAIETVSSNRAELGAFQNRMESTIRNISVAVENLSAAESRIRDTDMALEMVEFTRNQILSQAGTAMLAQANVVPQSVLSLLG